MIAANGNDGNLVEVTPSGKQVAKKLVDNTGSPPGAGTLFGLTALPGGVFFVDDGNNTSTCCTRRRLPALLLIWQESVGVLLY